MGTRADWYIGRGEGAAWIGSTAFDGYPDNDEWRGAFMATTADEFRAAVARFSERADFTEPTRGWPWPWDDSRTTDYAYMFDEGHVWVSRFGSEPIILEFDSEQKYPRKKGIFPKMASDQMAPAGTKRSGIMVFGIREEKA